MKTKILFLCTGNSCRSQIAEGWAPLMFVIIYVVGVCLFLPGTLLTALGAAIFGP